MPIKTVGNQRLINFSSYDYERFPVDLVRHVEPSEMQLYMYLWSMRNRGIEHLVLFSAHVMDDTGLSYKTYNKAFHNLIKDGFLVLESTNTYVFCPNKYSISDEEVMQFIYEYIYQNYPLIKKCPRINQTYVRYEDELDIFPEEPLIEIDYMAAFNEDADIPF